MVMACGGSDSPSATPVGPNEQAFPPTVAQGLAVHSTGCPPGMVRIQGQGTVGMRGQPYGVVQTGHMEKVDAPERMCPSAIARTPGATACWVQTDLVDPVLMPRKVAIADFCIDVLPFPGAGVPYPMDGLTAGTVALLDELLKTESFGGRRLCSATEIQVATAGPTSNLRFIYGDQRNAARCRAGLAIGADPGCKNPETGLREYGAIHSHWARADADFVAAACDEPPCRGAGNRILKVGAYVVMGGTSRVQTRQAPLTPHTWHDHGEPAEAGCTDQGWDDQAAICASLNPAYGPGELPRELLRAEKAWAEVVAATRSSGRVTAGIAQGLGRKVCPAGASR